MPDLLVVLSGVIAGGGISTGSNLILERRREGRQVATDGRREERELRQAARLVHQELGEAMWVLEHAVELYEWWPYPSRKFSDRRWHEFGQVLADYLLADDWLPLTFAYEDMRELEVKIDSIYRSHGKFRPFGVADDREVRSLWDSLDQAQQTIHGLAGESGRSGFDTVAAMQHAAMDAARQLVPGTGPRLNDPPQHRARMEVRQSCDVVGVAVVGAPNWRRFEAVIPKGFILTAIVPEISDTAACVMSALGDTRATSELAIRFVPEDIRNDDGFEDFAFIVDRRQRLKSFRELPPS